MNDKLNEDDWDLSDPAVVERLMEIQRRRLMERFEEQQKAAVRLANTKPEDLKEDK